MYLTLAESSIEQFTSIKWEHDLKTVISPEHWDSAFRICFKTLTDNYLVWHQYKILTRILGTQRRLYLMKISSNSLCRLCKEHEETLIHLFCTCDFSKDLWRNIQTWIFNKLSFNVPLDNYTIVLGYLAADKIAVPLNSIILIAKAYIFNCAIYQNELNIFQLQTRIKSNYNEQLYLATLKGKLKPFNDIWEQWQPLFVT